MQKTFQELLSQGQAGQKFIGTYIMNSGEFIIETMKMAGFDFVILDMEHERLTFSEIMPLIYVCEACGMVPAVRVPGIEEGYIKKALDMGAACVKVPDIKTAEDARKVVEWSKFPPEGHRGACPFVRGNNYGADREGCWERANRKTAVSLIIEGPEGIANANDIIAVDGVDCISVGQVDLSVTLGVPGQVFHPRVIQAVLDCADVCQKYRKQLSAQIVEPEDVKLYKNHPAITHFHTDMPQTIFYRACRDLCDKIRNEF